MYSRYLLSILGLLVLSGFGYVQHGRVSLLNDADLTAYHDSIRKVANNIPYVVGDYVGQDIPIPQGAIELLKPNVIISRRYSNLNNGATVDLLFVHCKDAQDMLGHHPPVCYPAHGWSTARGEDVVEGDNRFATYTVTQSFPGGPRPQTESLAIGQPLPSAFCSHGHFRRSHKHNRPESSERLNQKPQPNRPPSE